MPTCVLILHNIRSVHNTGSIFRTADGAGVANIILSGYTPTPLDRFGRPRSDFAKVALGAEKAIPWTYTSRLTSTLQKLKKEGFLILALEQDENSISLFAFTLPFRQEKIVLIAGNEVRGLSPQALKWVDHIVEIPMHGKKESLNVSVATGIALFSLLAQRKK